MVADFEYDLFREGLRHFCMHGEFVRLLFLQAHRETEAHFTATGMPSQRTNRTRSVPSARHSASLSLKSKVDLLQPKQLH
jgi:hypothetical protein